MQLSSLAPGYDETHVGLTRLPPESNLLISFVLKSVTNKLLLVSVHIPDVANEPVVVLSVSNRIPLGSKCFTRPLPIETSTSPLFKGTPFANAGEPVASSHAAVNAMAARVDPRGSLCRSL